MVSKTLTAESTNEQGKAGLTDCTPESSRSIQQLNADYNARFGFPFILAVRGPRGTGLTQGADHRHLRAPGTAPPGFRARRMPAQHPPHRRDPAGRQVRQRTGARQPGLGLGRAPGGAQRPRLRRARRADGDLPDRRAPRLRTRTGALDAGRLRLRRGRDRRRRQCGRRLPRPATRRRRRLLTGSHYDTVRNGGKYDGRLGILVPMACVRELHRAGRRLPFGIEVVGFAEEEGQRYKATFLGSGALTGHFDPRWLEQSDADGVVDARGDAAGRPVHRCTSPSCSATRRATSASSRCTSSRARCSTSSTCRWAW